MNACLFPVLLADGCHVRTIEGVGSWSAKYAELNCNGDASNSASNNANITNGKERKEGHLHLIHRAMVNFHGSQCGFCTPGIIMALYSLFSTKEYLDGNLYRCTDWRDRAVRRARSVQSKNGVRWIAMLMTRRRRAT